MVLCIITNNEVMHYHDNYAITSTAISIYYSSICDSIITIVFITTILLYIISILVAFMNIVVIITTTTIIVLSRILQI